MERSKSGSRSQRTLSVAMVGNHDLRVVPEAMVEFLTKLPPRTTILLRSGNKTQPGWFEQLVSDLCSSLWMSWRWIKPEPSDGRAGTFNRDVELVRQSDFVIAFFAGDEMTGGTAHVVEKAMDQRVPVYAYGIRDGRFVSIGEHDPDNIWAGFAPRV